IFTLLKLTNVESPVHSACRLPRRVALRYCRVSFHESVALPSRYGTEMTPKLFLNAALAADRVVIENATPAANVERKRLAPLREQDCWLRRGMRISQLVKHIRVHGRDLSDYHGRVTNTLHDVFDNKSGTAEFVGANRFKALLGAHRP